MKTILIIMSVLFAVALLAISRIYFTFESGDGNTLYLRFLFIKIRLFPKKVKKINLRNYSLKKIKKKKSKKVSSAGKKAEANDKKSSDGSDIKSVIIDILKKIISDFPKKVRTEELNLHLIAASGDAASAAIKFGLYNQFASLLCTVIDNGMPMKDENKRSICIVPDLNGIEAGFKLKITLSISIASVISFLGKIISSLFTSAVKAA